MPLHEVCPSSRLLPSLIMECEQTNYLIFAWFKQRQNNMVGESETNDRKKQREGFLVSETWTQGNLNASEKNYRLYYFTCWSRKTRFLRKELYCIYQQTPVDNPGCKINWKTNQKTEKKSSHFMKGGQIGLYRVAYWRPLIIIIIIQSKSTLHGPETALRQGRWMTHMEVINDIK